MKMNRRNFLAGVIGALAMRALPEASGAIVPRQLGVVRGVILDASPR